MVDVNTAFVLIAIVIFIGFLASKAFERFKVPDVAVLMLLGLLIGPVFGIVTGDALAAIKAAGPFFGTFVLIILLVEGGMSLKYKEVLKEAVPSIFFTFAAFLFSLFLMAGVAMAFGWSLLHALLLGAILAGNSSSVVLSLIRRVTIKEETKTVLSLESSINDSLVIITAIFLVQLIATGGVQSPGAVAQSFFGAFTISALFAFVAGVVWIKLLNVLKTKRYNYLLTLAAVLLLYVFTEGSRSNGAFAALVFGIVLGNSALIAEKLKIVENLEVRWNLQLAQEEITFFVRTFFFVFLGLVLDFAALSLATVLLASVVIAAKAVARYGAARVLARLHSEFTADEKMLAMMLPNGLAAAAMASYPAAFGITFGGQDLFLKVAFLVILLSNIAASAAVFYLEREKRKARPEGEVEETGEEQISRETA